MSGKVLEIIKYIIVNGVSNAYYDMNENGFKSEDIETARNELENIFGATE